MAHFSFIQPAEWGELSDDIRQLFDELAATRPTGSAEAAGTCRPLSDVVKADQAIELAVDPSGVPAASFTHTYHLVERDFGRFARVVRFTGAFDVERGAATLGAGQLTVVLPKRLERRGVAHRVTIRTTDGRQA